MNGLLTWVWNWDIAYNRLVNKELWEMIDEDDINEDFRNVISKIKTLIQTKEWRANVDELLQKIDEIIHQNRSRLPSPEYYTRTLRSYLYSKHKHLDLNQEWWEKELNKNIKTCLDFCLNSNTNSDKIIKELIVYVIMKQWYEYKRKRAEALHLTNNDTSNKIIHTLNNEEYKE